MDFKQNGNKYKKTSTKISADVRKDFYFPKLTGGNGKKKKNYDKKLKL